MKVCAEPGCPNLTAASRCETHQRKPWANRNGTTSRQARGIQRSGWQEQARNKATIAHHRGICHVCGKPGATQVDHVTPLSEGGKDTDDNRRPIHRTPCHDVKSAAEAARGRARKSGKRPKPKHPGAL